MEEQMNNTPQQTEPELTHDHYAMAWGWQIGLGTLLTIMGFAALSAPVLMSASAAALMGWFLVFAGIAQLIIAFLDRKDSNLAINAMIAVMYFVFGIILINSTLWASVVSITLFMAIFFLIDGIFKFVLSFQLRGERNWGWLLAGSIVSILFAILILSNLYASSFVLIGLMIGIQLIFVGIGMIFEGFAQRKELDIVSGKGEKKHLLLLLAIIALLTLAFIKFF
jgi:uncharacterized membrane protein HdeD (DUF308 family)